VAFPFFFPPYPPPFAGQIFINFSRPPRSRHTDNATNSYAVDVPVAVFRVRAPEWCCSSSPLRSCFRFRAGAIRGPVQYAWSRPCTGRSFVDHHVQANRNVAAPPFAVNNTRRSSSPALCSQGVPAAVAAAHTTPARPSTQSSVSIRVTRTYANRRASTKHTRGLPDGAVPSVFACIAPRITRRGSSPETTDRPRSRNVRRTEPARVHVLQAVRTSSGCRKHLGEGSLAF
jgi:hypothetical protein